MQLQDVTGDNIPDALTAPDGILTGNGDGTFTALSSYNTLGNVGLLLPTDFDLDGKTDFISTGTDSIYYGLPNAKFTQAAIGFPNSNQMFGNGHYAIGDFNHDGKPDIAASRQDSTGSHGIAIASSTTTARTFTYAYLTTPELNFGLAAGDLNGDGCVDFVAAEQTHLVVYQSDCHGNFTQVGSYLTGFSGPSYVPPFTPVDDAVDLALVDLDGDGILDLVVPISAENTALIFYGNGNGTFTQGASLPIPSSQFVTVGDLDNDGHAELIFTGHGLMTIFQGTTGRNHFSAPSYYPAGYETGKAILSDTRHHGRLDIAVPNLGVEGNLTNQQGNSFAIFLNTLPSLSSNTLNGKLFATPEPSAFGQTFTLTATFAPANNVIAPVGSISFTLDGIAAGTTALNNSGVATINISSSPAVGTHTVAAIFSGDTNFLPLTVTGSHVVTSETTTTTVSATPNPGIPFEPVALSAHVSSAYGMPTGSVSFTENGIPIGATQTLDTSGNASLPRLVLNGGTHSITATFMPTGNFGPSTDTIAELVQPFDTTSTITVTPSSAPYGTPVTLDVQVTPNTTTTGIPTGSLHFFVDNNLVSVGALASGHASYTFTPSAGSHNFSCAYGGDTNFNLSTCGNLPATTAPSITLLKYSVSSNPAPAGTNVTFSLNLSANAQPLPNAVLLLTLDPLAPVTLTTDASGNASFTTSALATGSHGVYAVYAATTNYAASNVSTSETITINPTALTLTTSGSPAFAGIPVTFAAHLTEGGNPLANAALKLNIGALTPISLTTDAAGNASYTTSSLVPDTYSVSAFYTATTSYSAATAVLTQVILVNKTTITLTGAPNPAYQGQTVTLTAATNALDTGGLAGGFSNSPGSVTFYEGTKQLGTSSVAPNTGKATFTISTLSVGAHILTATFTPSTPNYTSATSASFTETILPSAFTLALSPTTLTLPPGQTGATTVHFTSIGNFSGPLALTLGPLPNYATAHFGSSTVTLTAGGTASTTLSLTTLSLAQNERPSHTPLLFAAFTLLLFPLARRRKSLACALTILLSGTLFLSLTGCVNAGYTANHVAAGTYAIPVTATDSSHVQQTATLTVVVQ